MKNRLKDVDVSHTKCRILCVDDNRDSADSEAMLLRLHGFDTKVCYDGESAISEAPGYQPDICIIDLNMPGMDGDVLAGRLRADSGGRLTAYVALTAMSNEKSRNRIEAAGFNSHFVKPVNPDDFIKEVERLCQRLLN